MVEIIDLIFETIKEIKKKQSCQRLGQILINYGCNEKELFAIKDSELLFVLERNNAHISLKENIKNDLYDMMKNSTTLKR